MSMNKIPNGEIEINTNIDVQAVLNIDTVIEKYASEFTHYYKKATKGHLQISRIIYECNSKLGNDEDFDKFCDKVGIDAKSSSIRKFKVIGKKFDLLYKHADCLPRNWTTLYEIARLEDDKIERLIEEGLIHPTTTGFQLKQLVNEPIMITACNISDDAEVIEGEIVQNETERNEVFCNIVISEEFSNNQTKLLALLKEIDNLKSIGCQCIITEKFSSITA